MYFLGDYYISTLYPRYDNIGKDGEYLSQLMFIQYFLIINY